MPSLQASWFFRFLLALAALASLPALALGNKPATQEDDKAVLERIRPVATVEFAAEQASGAAAASGRSGAEIVNTLCAACHATGAAGAPKVGDKAAWAPRLKQGLDGLVKSAAKGKGAMPPKGGADVSMEELTSAVAYMANQSGASFKAPAK